MNKPITPEEMKAYVDATWDKCQTEAWIKTNNQVFAMLIQAHDVLALSSLPPKKKWVGLTDEEKNQVAWSCGAMSADWLEFSEAIEAKLKEKNT